MPGQGNSANLHDATLINLCSWPFASLSDVKTASEVSQYFMDLLRSLGLLKWSHIILWLVFVPNNMRYKWITLKLLSTTTHRDTL